MKKEIILEAKSITKTFGPTIALNKVDFKLFKGEVRGLIGENGSGKSTLTSILCGAQAADQGDLFYKDMEYEPMSVVDAQKQGITMILQEAGTISGISVAQNLFIGSERKFLKNGFINYRLMIEEANMLLEDFGLDNIQAKDKIENYSFEQRKLFEIVRALREKPEVLIVDETTTALSHEGRELLYRLIREMSEDNRAVIFISHDLDEIYAVCNVLTVLRDGQVIGELLKEEMEDSIVRKMMVGREMNEQFYRSDYDSSCEDEVALSLNNISFQKIKNFNLNIHKGEIVGIGGLSGEGMHDIGRIAFGLEKLDAGNVILNNKYKIESPQQAISLGIGYISKDRDKAALVLSGSVKENLVMPSLSNISNKSFIDPRIENKLSENTINALSIKCRDKNQLVKELSGGNKQKVSFGKWIAKESHVIIMDCPTRGVDIGVKQSMYELIEKMKRDGKAILFISEELTELIGMCDRIVILKDFKVNKEFYRHADLRDSDIIEYMI